MKSTLQAINENLRGMAVLNAMKKKIEEYAAILEQVTANNPALTTVSFVKNKGEDFLGRVRNFRSHDDMDVLNDYIVEVLTALKVNTFVKIVDLSETDMNAAVLTACAKTLKDNTTLESLNLANNNLFAEYISIGGGRGRADFSGEIIELFDSLAVNKTLRILDLSGNNIPDKLLAKCKNPLKWNASLRILGINIESLEKPEPSSTLLFSSVTAEADLATRNKELQSEIERLKNELASKAKLDS